MSIFILLHPKKDWDDVRIKTCMTDMAAVLKERGLTGTLTSGRQAFEAHFAACRKNWERWGQTVATGKDMQKKSYYDVFVLPSPIVAKGSAQITTLALEAKKPVLLWDEETKTFTRVTSIIDTDPSNRWFGWKAITEGTPS